MEHEYAVHGGVSRAKVGKYLSFISAAVSSGAVFVLLSMVDVAKRLGINATLPPSILSLFSAGAVFTVLYWFLNCYAWRWNRIGLLLKVPNISGEWHCNGQALNQEGSKSYQWEAKITIIQSWDKLRVRLKTSQSGSNSETAALVYDEAEGYRLIYNYRNDPHIGEVDLKSHRGFAEIVFTKDLQSGMGEYFNGCGRYTFGTMKLSKV